MKMQPFSLSLTGWIFRFYLMMAVIIAAGFTANWWLALFAVPIFASAMMGVSFSYGKKGSGSDKVVQLEKAGQLKKKAS